MATSCATALRAALRLRSEALRRQNRRRRSRVASSSQPVEERLDPVSRPPRQSSDTGVPFARTSLNGAAVSQGATFDHTSPLTNPPDAGIVDDLVAAALLLRCAA